MSRVFKSESGRTERDRLLKSVVKAIRHLMTQSEPGEEGRDVVSYVVLALYHVHNTIDQSVLAWEKRGYWLKADRYRMEWEWCLEKARMLHEAVLEDDWSKIIPQLISTGEHLQQIQLPQRDRLGTPWTGAWDLLQDRPLQKPER